MLLLILVAVIFFRFYEMGSRNPFGYDQADFAWQAKDIVVDHKLPLLGPQAKLNSGIFMGPAYYYLSAVFYFLTNLDPAASGIFAGVTSLFTFLITYFIIKKLFSNQVALIAVFIQTFSAYIINFDRTQWSVNFVAPVSLLIFYALYRIMTGQPKYLLLLAVSSGFSFHLHFTSTFFLGMILLALPFFPRKVSTVKYLLISLPLLAIWLVPNFLSGLNKNMTTYLGTYYHGFHLRRFFQLTNDALIEFEGILTEGIVFLRKIKILEYLFLPIFWLSYILAKPNRGKLILSYLVFLWIFIPWLGFSLYSGEISVYYFSLTRPVVIMVLAYLTSRLLASKFLVLKLSVIIFWLSFSVLNAQKFMVSTHRPTGLDYQKEQVQELISRGGVVTPSRASASSYLYYFYTHK